MKTHNPNTCDLCGAILTNPCYKIKWTTTIEKGKRLKALLELSKKLNGVLVINEIRGDSFEIGLERLSQYFSNVVVIEFFTCLTCYNTYSAHFKLIENNITPLNGI